MWWRRCSSPVTASMDKVTPFSASWERRISRFDGVLRLFCTAILSSLADTVRNSEPGIAARAQEPPRIARQRHQPAPGRENQGIIADCWGIVKNVCYDEEDFVTFRAIGQVSRAVAQNHWIPAQKRPGDDLPSVAKGITGSPTWLNSKRIILPLAEV